MSEVKRYRAIPYSLSVRKALGETWPGEVEYMVPASDHDATVAELRAELERVRGELERMRALNKASHAVLAHAFGAHEMQWSERCVRCGQTDSVLNDAPCTALTPKEPV